jgi:hypothetical protein
VKNKQLQWTRPIFILAGATIEAHVQNDGISASSFSVATHQQLLISVPSINIVSYAHLFTFHLLFIQHPQIAKNSIAGADEARRNLLNTNVGYAHLDECAGRDNFLLVNPLHRHLFPRLTCYLLSTSLLVGMEN